MYMLFVTWLTLTPPYYGEQYLHTYKNLDKCKWALQWVIDNNNIKYNRRLECRKV